MSVFFLLSSSTAFPFYLFPHLLSSVFYQLSSLLLLLLLQRSRISPELYTQIFSELAEMVVPNHSKRIVIWSKEIFRYEEFQFLFKDFEKRWILDINRLYLDRATNIQPPPKTGKNTSKAKPKWKLNGSDTNYNALVGIKQHEKGSSASTQSQLDGRLPGKTSAIEGKEDDDNSQASHETASETVKKDEEEKTNQNNATTTAVLPSTSTTPPIVWYSKLNGAVLQPPDAIIEPKSFGSGKKSEKTEEGEQVRMVWKPKKPLPLERVALKVTGGSYCSRGRYCYWQKDASLNIPLRHLGIRCRLLLEFLIAISPHRSIKYRFWNDIVKEMIEEWKVKFKDKLAMMELEKKAGDHMGEEATDGESGEVDDGGK